MSRFPFVDPSDQAVINETRRQFFARGARGLGVAALASLVADEARAATVSRPSIGGLPGLPHFAPKAKRAIYLHMVGAPPQHDLFDYKPTMKEWFDKDLPESVRMGQRLTTMTSGQTRFPIAPSVFKFQHIWESPARGFRNCCRGWRRWLTIWRSFVRSTLRPSITSRRSHSFRPAIRFPASPASDRGSLTASAA